MEDFFSVYRIELLWSLITIVIAFIIKYGLTKAARKVAKIGGYNEIRTNLIVKYISMILTLTTIAILVLIWGVNFKDLSLLLSSFFAVLGVALFAQWSILSNITSGVIIFFSYPFKIGNIVRVMDKEINDAIDENVFIIEDIKAFHIHLRRRNGEILTYPNNMVLQKGVALVTTFNENLNDQFEQLPPQKTSDTIENM